MLLISDLRLTDRLRRIPATSRQFLLIAADTDAKARTDYVQAKSTTNSR
jgi:hypothetical protein